MKNFIFFVLLGILCWIAYGKYMEYITEHSKVVDKASAEREASGKIAKGDHPFVYASDFKCDGRTTCQQMRTCDEAMFFLKNCQTSRMDNNSDGIPCETGVCAKP